MKKTTKKHAFTALLRNYFPLIFKQTVEYHINTKRVQLLFLGTLFLLLGRHNTLHAQAGLKVEKGSENTSSNTGGYAWIGDPSASHLSLDNNEIQARDNNSPRSLFLNDSGGNIFMARSLTGKVRIGDVSAPYISKVTIGSQDTAALRLYNLSYSYGQQARMNFGDEDYVYLEEDEDDKLLINAEDRLSLMGRYIGVGTLNPSSKLHVQNLDGDVSLKVQSKARSLSSIEIFEDQDYGYEFQYDGDSDKFHLWSRKFSNNEGIRMTWLKNGNVGIGTTSPSTRLDIQGSNEFNIMLRSMINYDDWSNSSAISRYAIIGECNSKKGYGAFLKGGYTGLYVSADNEDINGSEQSYSIYAQNRAEGSGTKYGIISRASTNAANTATIIGLYGSASTTSSVTSWAGYFNGNLECTGTFTQPSDERLKRNIRTMDNSLEKIMQLSPKTYEFKTQEYDYINLAQGKQLGFLSQEVEKVFPELVEKTEHVFHDFDSKGGEDDQGNERKVKIKSLNYIGLIPVLTGAIQEQQRTIESQELTISDQEQQIATLQTRLEQLEILVQSLVTNTTSTETRTQAVELNSNTFLAQNNPNPFNEETKIAYELPNDIRQALLQITDQSGRIVKTIEIAERGKGAIILQAGMITAGNYQYSLILDGKLVESKQMVLTK